MAAPTKRTRRRETLNPPHNRTDPDMQKTRVERKNTRKAGHDHDKTTADKGVNSKAQKHKQSRTELKTHAKQQFGQLEV